MKLSLHRNATTTLAIRAKIAASAGSAALRAGRYARHHLSLAGADKF